MRFCQDAGLPVTGMSRTPATNSLVGMEKLADCANAATLIWAAPIWTFREWSTTLESSPPKRIVAISSTSALSKQASSLPEERIISLRLSEGEKDLEAWCHRHGVSWAIFRPTLIYGNQDKNINEIRQMIARTGMFPVLGKGVGKRQPLHVDDLAKVCIASALTTVPANRIAILTGGETLTYKEMVGRVFVSMGKTPRIPSVPIWMFRSILLFLRLFPRYRHWNDAMVSRMNSDLAFECDPCVKTLGIEPRTFDPRS